MSRRLHVQNLSHAAGREELARLFEPFGNVKSVRVIDLLETGGTTATGFVEMQTEAQGHAAIVALNGKSFFGTNLFVTWAEFVPGKALKLSSCDTADGSEQPNHSTDAQGPVAGDGGAQWDDDGGKGEALWPGTGAWEKPTWSVRSLRALLDAILRSYGPRAVRIRKHTAAWNQNRIHDDVTESEMSEGDLARRDRYRTRGSIPDAALAARSGRPIQF
jgi:RNA recognition motif-containing protein